MKYINQHLFACWIVIMLLASCSDTNQKKELESKEKEIDSLKTALELKENQPAIDTLNSINLEKSDSLATIETETKTNEVDKERLAGKHNLTLQWISWEKPGEITFTSIGDNKYEVDGFQKGAKSDECPDCYLKVKGTIVEITPKRLTFTGTIESSVHYIQNGEPCIKEGTFDFVSTKNRKYWRCRNMAGCDGVTDYVDIYF